MTVRLPAGIEEHADLLALNTLRLPVAARFFSRVHDIDATRRAVEFAQAQGLAPIVLGEGSNVVLGARLEALILQLALRGINVIAEEPDYVDLRVGAGENWHQLVQHCLGRRWYGLENLALIPGRVGAAPIQNIGAYGTELSEFCRAVEALEIATGKQCIISAGDCGFAYRDSVFKRREKDHFIITAVQLRLSREPRLRIDYQPLREALERLPQPPTAQDVFDTVCRIRRDKLPDPSNLPNVGSFFKNPLVDTDKFAAIRADYPDIVAWPRADGVKLAAAWLLDKDGWRGRRSGSLGMHQRQALVMVNYGGANADDVLEFAAQISTAIQERFGVQLDIEPQRYR